MTRKLDRLNASNSTGVAFQRLWQRNCELNEANFNDLQTQITDIANALAAAQAADTKARARMDDLPDVVFDGDYTGALAAGQLPMDIAVKRYDGTTNVSALSTWTRTVESGDVTCTIGAATGVLNTTAISTDSVVRIESTKDGLTLRKKQALNVQLAAPPNTGGTSGGATTWSDTTLSSTSSTSMAVISDELVVAVGASGTVSLTAPITSETTPNSTSEGASPIAVYGRWQWYDGATWQDLGASETASSPNCIIALDGDTGLYYLQSRAALSVSASKTGLTAGSSQKFRLNARCATAAFTMTYKGTATASTS